MNSIQNSEQREIERLKTLLAYSILDTPIEKKFEDLVKLVSLLYDVPIALITFIDDQRQWYKAKTGTHLNEVPIKDSICQYTMAAEEFLEICDTKLDQRVKDNPHVAVEDGIRYYAGLPIRASNGHNLGTLCIADTKPQSLTKAQKESLGLITGQIEVLLEARQQNKVLKNELEGILKAKIKKESEYERLFDAISRSSGLMEFTPDGKIQSVNSNFEQTIGFKESELIGQFHSVLLDPNTKEKYLEFWEALKRGEHKSGRMKRIHKSGKEIWIQASYNPILNLENRVVKVIEIAHNITYEIESNKATEKARRLAEDLNKQKDHFITNMSHELRTPINAIIGFTDLLIIKEELPENIEQLTSVKTAADTLLFLVNDILDLSKIESGLFQIDKAPFDLGEVIKSVFSILILKARYKKIDFTYELDEGLHLELMGDKNRLAQILINLLGNAVKFTPQGFVKLRVFAQSLEPGWLNYRFEVADSGIGIEKEKLQIVFDRFSQAETDTSRKYGGTGLGLNISKHLIEIQGGKISLESELGKGTTFYFNIPFQLITESHLFQKDTIKTDRLPRIGGRVLLCEDNELNQKLIEAIFSATDLEVDIASNGVDGLKMASEAGYDLILMDIQMPEMDGFQTTDAIRNQLQLQTPIIALTAHSMVSEKNKSFACGMDDYLSKPFDRLELLNKIHFWISSNKAKALQIDQYSDESTLSMAYLKEISKGDLDFQKELIVLFIQQSEEFLANIAFLMERKNYPALTEMAHKMKTSFGIIGASKDHLDAIEDAISKDDQLACSATIEQLEAQIYQLNHQLKEKLKQYEK